MNDPPIEGLKSISEDRLAFRGVGDDRAEKTGFIDPECAGEVSTFGFDGLC